MKSLSECDWKVKIVPIKTDYDKWEPDGYVWVMQTDKNIGLDHDTIEGIMQGSKEKAKSHFFKFAELNGIIKYKIAEDK